MTLKSLATAAALSLFTVTTGNAATLVSQFTFDSGYTDNAGGATATGVGSVSGGRYNFGIDEGLSVTMGAPLSAYSIVFSLEFDYFNTYNRLLDISGQTSDNGLYVNNTGLRYYNAAGGFGPSGAFTPNVDATVVLTFDGTTTTGYVDGSQAFSFAQSGAGYLGTLTSFDLFDDDHPPGVEEAPGSLDFLEVYSGVLTSTEVAAYTGPAPISPVPLPAGGMLLLTGLFGAVALKRRKRSAA